MDSLEIQHRIWSLYETAFDYISNPCDALFLFNYLTSNGISLPREIQEYAAELAIPHFCTKPMLTIFSFSSDFIVEIEAANALCWISENPDLMECIKSKKPEFFSDFIFEADFEEKTLKHLRHYYVYQLAKCRSVADCEKFYDSHNRFLPPRSILSCCSFWSFHGLVNLVEWACNLICGSAHLKNEDMLSGLLWSSHTINPVSFEFLFEVLVSNSVTPTKSFAHQTKWFLNQLLTHATSLNLAHLLSWCFDKITESDVVVISLSDEEISNCLSAVKIWFQHPKCASLLNLSQQVDRFRIMLTSPKTAPKFFVSRNIFSDILWWTSSIINHPSFIVSIQRTMDVFVSQLQLKLNRSPNAQQEKRNVYQQILSLSSTMVTLDDLRPIIQLLSNEELLDVILPQTELIYTMMSRFASLPQHFDFFLMNFSPLLSDVKQFLRFMDKNLPRIIRKNRHRLEIVSKLVDHAHNLILHSDLSAHSLMATFNLAECVAMDLAVFKRQSKSIMASLSLLSPLTPTTRRAFACQFIFSEDLDIHATHEIELVRSFAYECEPFETWVASHLSQFALHKFVRVPVFCLPSSFISKSSSLLQEEEDSEEEEEEHETNDSFEKKRERHLLSSLHRRLQRLRRSFPPRTVTAPLVSPYFSQAGMRRGYSVNVPSSRVGTYTSHSQLSSAFNLSSSSSSSHQAQQEQRRHSDKNDEIWKCFDLSLYRERIDADKWPEIGPQWIDWRPNHQPWMYAHHQEEEEEADVEEEEE